jgi:tetratricopeptide (TPR) repeat protein
VSYSVVSYIRVNNWSSYENFILISAENHPDSARSNFMAGQVFISALMNSEGHAPELANASRAFLQKGIAADPRCINCMFGLIVLDLHLDRQPDTALVARLADSLRSGYVGPTKVSISQFSYLVKWQQAGSSTLPNESLEAIFDAALVNPAWSHTGRAGIEAAYAKYWDSVAQDLPKALQHARAAVRSWPDQWSYHMAVVRLLQKLGRMDEAMTALDEATRVADNQTKQLETAEVRAEIERASEK